MLIPGILGFQSLLYVFLLVGFLVIRHMWRNAEAKKEEIIRLVDMVSEESAVVEMAASAEYSSIPVLHQCAMCYAPTTMRCSKCKAVRYCSGKCQIIHWRQGHKDECCPPVSTTQLKDKSNSSSAALSETEHDLYDTKGTQAGISPSNNSDSGFRPPAAANKQYDHDSCNRLAKPVCNNAAYSPYAASSMVNETVFTGSFFSESKSLVDIDVNNSNAKRSKTNSSYSSDENGSKVKLPKSKTDISQDGEANVDGQAHRREVATYENSVTDASKYKTLPPSSYSVADDAEKKSHLSKYRDARQSSCSANGCLSSTTKGGILPNSKSENDGICRDLPAKVGSIPNLPQNIRNGFKTSMRKVVQQFKSSSESRSNPLSVENEMGFPYQLFMELYNYDKMELCPFGLTNCGNSCYANAVLQCLAYTRPLTSYLLQGLHSKRCQKKGWCFICEFEYLIQKAREGISPLSPIGILSKIHKIGSHLGPGREEDAHEFLRCSVETMQAVCLKEAGVMSPLAEETTLIGYTFVGYLRSKIKCLRCLGKSERYERMMDLTVEIDGDIGTLEGALRQFTAPEILEKDNKYNCSRCKSYEKARKKLTVLEAPNILTIVLKRFQSGSFEKLNKSIQFPDVLNMAPYMSGTKDKSPLYSLYAVVVHLDTMNTAYSGHYVCYVKNLHGEWFRIDDSRVEPVDILRVLSERAYMLLYARHTPKPPGSVSSNAISSVGKFKRRNLDSIPTNSKTRSNYMTASADPSFVGQKHGKYSHRHSVDIPFGSVFAYPDEWKFHCGGRKSKVDSSSESSSLFSSSDASSCSTSSTKDSASTADFTDYIFGEAGTNWYSHYGFSSDSIASTSYENLSTDLFVDSDAYRRLRQDSEGNADLQININKNHSGSRGPELQRYGSANYNENNGVHGWRTSRDTSAQTFY